MFFFATGIIGNNDCTYKESWQAFKCSGANVKDYAMLVIESLDEDTELRRLSPVALLSERYIDLHNGEYQTYFLYTT